MRRVDVDTVRQRPPAYHGLVAMDYNHTMIAQRGLARKPAGNEGNGTGMSNGDLSWITNFIWGIADDVLRDLYVRGKYRDVILPMTVLRRLDGL